MKSSLISFCLFGVLCLGADAASYDVGSRTQLKSYLTDSQYDRCLLNLTADINLTSAISNKPSLFTNGIVVNGNGHTITTTGNDGMFFVGSGNKVTFSNVVFSAGRAYRGGAICNEGDLFAINCSFVNNTATYGGAIYGRDVNLINCTLCGNQADSAANGQALYGAAILANCTFVGNNVSVSYQTYLYAANCIFAGTGVTSSQSLVCLYNCLYDANSVSSGTFETRECKSRVQASDVFAQGNTPLTHGSGLIYFPLKRSCAYAAGAGVWTCIFSGGLYAKTRYGERILVSENFRTHSFERNYVEVDQIGQTIGNPPSIGAVYAEYRPEVAVTAKGYSGDYDGAAHGVSVAVTEPASGATVLYSLNQTGPWTTLSPQITGPCQLMPVWYAVTADGYDGKTNKVYVTIRVPEPTIEVTAQQRYPWNGKVDVKCVIDGHPSDSWKLALTAKDEIGGTNLPMKTVARLDGANENDFVVGVGSSRFVWDAKKDLGGGTKFSGVSVTAQTHVQDPVWTFDAIPKADPDDEWAPTTVYHDIQTVVGYGEVESRTPSVRCLSDVWKLSDTLSEGTVFSGTSMALRYLDNFMVSRGCLNPLLLWASNGKKPYRLVTLDYEMGKVVYDCASEFAGYPDARLFTAKSDFRAYAIVNRKINGYDAYVKSANTDLSSVYLRCRYGDNQHGSAVCSYFYNGMPFTTATETRYPSEYPGSDAAVFSFGSSGTDKRQFILKPVTPAILAESTYSCMKNPVGRYVVPLLDASTYFTVANCYDGGDVPQYNGLVVGNFADRESRRFDFCHSTAGAVNVHSKSYTKGVAMPDGKRIFLGGDGFGENGRVRMWVSSDSKDTFCDYPSGHPFESPNRRDITCLLPNGKFCGVDEKLGLVVVNPLTGEWYVASDDPAFKVGKMGCQLLPNGKVLIIPYNAADDRTGNLDVCGKLYEVDFGFTRSFTLSTLMSPYVRVAEGEPEPSGVRITLNPNGGTCDTLAVYRTGGNPTYGTLPTPTRKGYAFRGWGASATATKAVSSGDAVPQSGVVLYAMWGEALYMVVDLSGGKDATSYPVSYLADVPSGGWSDTYKTTKLVLRKIKAGSNSAGGNMSKDMWVGVFEVTQKQWILVGLEYPEGYTGTYYYNTKNDRYPIQGMGRSSGSFRSKLSSKCGLSIRKPTFDEWEYACRAGCSTALNNGTSLTLNNANKVAYWGVYVSGATAYNQWKNGTSAPTTVGRYEPNAWGLYDMHGNVCEEISCNRHSHYIAGGSAYCAAGGDMCSELNEIKPNSEAVGDGNIGDAGLRIFANVE